MSRLLAKVPMGKIRLDYVLNPVTTGAWTEVAALIPSAATSLEIFNGNGSVIKLSTGNLGLEDASELLFFVFPGGTTGLIPSEQMRGRRLSARAVDVNCTTGQMLINLYG